MATEKKYTVRFDEKLVERIELRQGTKNMSASEAIRDFVEENADEFSTALLQIKTATNLTSMQMVETQKHISIVSEVLSSRLPNVDKNIQELATRITTIEKNMETIGQLLLTIQKQIKSGNTR